MSEFYLRMQDTALGLIDRFGTDCVIKGTDIQGGSDPITGLPLPPIKMPDQNARCVVLNYGYMETALRNTKGSLIESSDKRILISAKGVDMPQPNSKIHVGDRVYTIVEVKDTDIIVQIPLIYEVKARE